MSPLKIPYLENQVVLTVGFARTIGLYNAPASGFLIVIAESLRSG